MRYSLGTFRFLFLIIASLLFPGSRALPQPFAPGSAVNGLIYSVAEPVSVADARASGAAKLDAALQQIRQAAPAVTMVHFFVEENTGEADWLALLDVCQRRGFQAAFGFAVPQGQDDYIGFRPRLIGNAWQLGVLGDFAKSAAVVRHPAFYALLTLDEPWHGEKTPFYTTDELKSLYQALKRLSPEPAKLKIVVQFSRQLWRRLVDSNRPELYWDSGICDIVQISALEFQNGGYQSDLLDANHYWSRKIVHEKTPDIPLWSSVQVFGARLGPSQSYWFPREGGGASDLRTLLDDILRPKYQVEHRLTGLMLQKWDSERARSSQYTLGDAPFPDQPEDQRAAASDALRTFNTWVEEACRECLVAVRAAGWQASPLAPESIVAAFGSQLSTTSAAAPTPALPEELAGTQVRVVDGAGKEWKAPIYAVTPEQVNFLMPSGAQPGPARVQVRQNSTGRETTQSLRISRVAPGIFTVDAANRLPAALILRVGADGSQSYEAVTAPASGSDQRAVPVRAAQPGESLYLLLFGSGIRNRSDQKQVSVTAAGIPQEVQYGGPHPLYPGLDQSTFGSYQALPQTKQSKLDWLSRASPLIRSCFSSSSVVSRSIFLELAIDLLPDRPSYDAVVRSRLTRSTFRCCRRAIRFLLRPDPTSKRTGCSSEFFQCK